MPETKCKNCGEPLGVPVGEVPFFVQDGDGTNGGKTEPWCARCFVHHRAPLEPDRFQPHRPHIGQGGYRAIKCTSPRCGLISVDTGAGRCMQCGCHSTIELGPKDPSTCLGWSEEAAATAGLKVKKK